MPSSRSRLDQLLSLAPGSLPSTTVRCSRLSLSHQFSDPARAAGLQRLHNLPGLFLGQVVVNQDLALIGDLAFLPVLAKWCSIAVETGSVLSPS